MKPSTKLILLPTVYIVKIIIKTNYYQNFKRYLRYFIDNFVLYLTKKSDDYDTTQVIIKEIDQAKNENCYYANSHL